MDISVIVPAYNESENLLDLLDALERFVLGAPCNVQVIIVDDGSDDGTAELLRSERERRPWLKLAANSGNKGMGVALKKGTEAAVNPMVVWVMADCSDRLDDIWDMHRAIEAGADLVVASRAATGGSYGDFVGIKAFGSRMFSRFARLLLRLPVHDSTNAFRAFRRSLLAELQLESDDFAISPEMVIKAVAQNKKVAEVPTVYQYRLRGVSSFRALRMCWSYLLLTVRAWLVRLSGSAE